MPIRSSGCLTCRKRKIRCDETRPTCKRCATHNVPCPGYRTDKPGGIEFKDQTNLTVKRAEDQYKAKNSYVVSTWDSSQGSDSSNESTGTSNGGTPPLLPNASRVTPIDKDPTQKQSLVLVNGFYHTQIGEPTQLQSPSLERARLYNEFITTYLPRTQAGAQNGHFSFFQTIALKRSDQPALEQSFDALSLVQIGSVYKDQNYLKQAVKQYSNALNSLARTIAKGQYLHDDDLLAAVTVMATCELYEEIQDSGEGWMKHVQGSNQLVAMRGPQSINTDLALLLYSNMRHGSLLHALIARKAPFMATPEWRVVAFRVPRAAMDESTVFYDMAIQVPGLLERHDDLDLDSPTALEEIDGILEDANRLEIQLRHWFEGWQARAVFNGKPLNDVRPIDDFPTFISLCSDRTFDRAYQFPDFLVGYLHSLYWMIMHYLRTTAQALHKHRHNIEHDWYPDADAVVLEDELLGYILNLCQCIPFFVEPISSSTGSIAIFLPLRCAATYFTTHGHWKWLKWIGNVRNTVFVKGLSPPSVKTERGKVNPGP